MTASGRAGFRTACAASTVRGSGLPVPFFPAWFPPFMSSSPVISLPVGGLGPPLSRPVYRLSGPYAQFFTSIGMMMWVYSPSLPDLKTPGLAWELVSRDSVSALTALRKSLR